VTRGAEIDEIEAVYRAKFASFVRVAAGIAGAAAADDAVHDAFVAAVKGRRHYTGRGSLEAWLWKAVVRSALKRTAKYGPQATAIVSDDSVGDLDEEHEARRAHIRRAVSSLPDRQRTVLFLRYYADLDYQTIADIVGVQRGTISATLHAAHMALKNRLTAHEVTK
jgi:RNA polymerase sigma-70 factor (ECF subfamily)